jgi:hypothetical protein
MITPVNPPTMFNGYMMKSKYSKNKQAWHRSSSGLFTIFHAEKDAPSDTKYRCFGRIRLP